MKTSIKIIAFLLTLVIIPVLKGEPVTANSEVPGDTLKVRTGSALNDFVTRWAAEYIAAFPGSRISVVRNDNIDAGQVTEGTLSLMSGEELKGSGAATEWNMVVARDVIVPVINASNPCYKMMQEHGVDAEKLGELLSRLVLSPGESCLKGNPITRFISILLRVHHFPVW
ncbi:MAG: hypothetical protein R2744_10745 [Bacteroidales bacterium]